MAQAGGGVGAVAAAGGGAVPERPFQGHAWTALGRCASGHGGRAGGVLEGWSLFGGPFQVGEVVALEQKSNLRHCHAEVVGDILGTDAGPHAGAQAVRVISGACGATAGGGNGGASGDGGESRAAAAGLLHKDPRKMARVLPAVPPRVLIMADTTTYRRMAKTQVGKQDAVLEIGSAFGECTRVLSCHAAAVVGVDVSQELVEESRRRNAQLRFEWLDCFEEPDRLASLWAELCRLGALKIFVDVGGDRAAPDVCQVLAALGCTASAAPTTSQPQLIVVKSRELARFAEDVACSELGEIQDVASWWAAAAAPPPPRSVKQEKRKYSRARKAYWADQPDDGGAYAAAHAAREAQWTAAKAKVNQLRLRKKETARKELLLAWRRACPSSAIIAARCRSAPPGGAAATAAAAADGGEPDDDDGARQKDGVCCPAGGPRVLLRHWLERLSGSVAAEGRMGS